MNLQVEKNRIFIVSDIGKKLEIVPSFERDNSVIMFLGDVDICKIIKKQSQHEFKSKKDNKTKHYYNFYICLVNGKLIQIKVKNVDDLPILDAISDYVK